jgi:Flp pilus assembly protein TadD
MFGKKKDSEGQSQEQDLIELGKFYFLNEKYDKAIEEFERAMTLNRADPEVYYNLGVVYEAKNMKQEAKEMFTKVLQLDENHQPAQQHLDKLVGT